MTTEEVKAVIPILIVLRDEAIDEGFEPAGNIAREHHRRDMLETWADAFALSRSIELCERVVQMMEENDEPTGG